LRDSREEWVHEAKMMSNIYRYGFINIAATGAEQSTEGCVWERDPQAVRPTEFFVQWNNCEENERRRYQVVPDHTVPAFDSYATLCFDPIK
jgi:hypothetical protein